MTYATPSNSRKSTLYRPAVSESLNKSILFYSKITSPFTNCHGFAVIFDPCIISAIIVLLVNCRPSAIFRGVARIVVNSVERMAIRSFPHISQKVLKLHPSFTNRNSTAAVILEISMRWIKASLLHCRPRLVSWSFKPSSCVPMSSSQSPVLAVASFHVSGTNLRNNSFSLFTASFAPEKAVHVPVY